MLILAGMILGDIFAVFILHPNADRIGAQLVAAANAVSAHRPDAANASFTAIGRMIENRGTKVDAHVHIIDFGYVALVLAFIQPWVGFGAARKRRLAVWFLIGAALLPIAVFLIYYVALALSPWKFLGWASVAADLGGLIVIAVCVMELYGVYRFLAQPLADPVPIPLPPSNGLASRILLSGGTLLIVAGFLFGAYYAAFSLYQHEAQEVSILTRLIDASIGGSDTAQVTGEYGFLQADKATKIAAHAHYIEFGVIAFLLGMIQQVVFLSESWKAGWAVILLIGSFVLPTFVALELKLGLVAGGIADLGGVLVIVSLCAMLAGVVRTTGRMDAVGGEG